MILRNGAIDDNVYERSVRKRLQGVMVPAGKLRPSLSGSPASFRTAQMGFLSVVNAVNDLAAEGIRPEEIRVTLLLPEKSEESLLRSIVDEIREAAETAGVLVSACHAETNSAVVRPVVFTQAQGKTSFYPAKAVLPNAQVSGVEETESEQRQISDPPGGREILMLGRAGLEGTFLLAAEKRVELEMRFPLRMLERAAAMKELLLMTPAVEALGEIGIRPAYLVNGAGGGVFAALWELSKESGCGITVELPELPLLQETIEITDYYGINPYQMCSAGCMLAVVENAENASALLAEHGIYSKPVGRLTEGRDKILLNGEERQNLNRPDADALLPLLG